MDQEIPRGSLEFIRGQVTADVDLTMVVALAVTPLWAVAGTYSWLAAEWTGAVGKTRIARTSAAVQLSAPTYADNIYAIFAKLTDTPEAPILHVGTLTLT